MLMQTLNFPGQHFEEDKDFLTIQQRALDLIYFFFSAENYFIYTMGLFIGNQLSLAFSSGFYFFGKS